MAYFTITFLIYFHSFNNIFIYYLAQDKRCLNTIFGNINKILTYMRYLLEEAALIKP